MKLSASLPRRAWVLALAGAAVFVGVIDHGRIQRVETVSSLAEESAAADAHSPTGWAGNRRWLIIPEPSDRAYEAIEATQQMVATGEWRIHHLDLEDAPTGSAVLSASPYRWWLAALAALDHTLRGYPIGRSVERAALAADPVLLGLLLVGAVLFAARRFGALAASGLAIGLVAWFPFGAAYLPGIATDFGLTLGCQLFSVLLLAAAVAQRASARGLFFLSGIAGGLALWFSATGTAPLLVGTAVGAAFAIGISRPRGPVAASDRRAPAWRLWGIGGATVSVFGYLVEYFPSHLTWDVRINHPLYGLAWLGIAELLQRLASKTRGQPWIAHARAPVALVLALLAVAALPVALILMPDRAFLAGDFWSTRLANLPGSPIAASTGAWLAAAPPAGLALATLLPACVLLLALWRWADKSNDPFARAALALVLVPALVAFGLALHHLRWWASFDALALVLLVVVLASAHRGARWLAGLILAGAAGAGIAALLPPPALDASAPKLTRTEVQSLYERALAHWIADHAGSDGATVLAPPLCTASFAYFGNLHGLGALGWENRDGLSASYRIASSLRSAETQALLNQHGVTHIVLPSWDPELDDLAKMGAKQENNSFVATLHLTDGSIFSWLRPIPYSLPDIPGFEESSVLVFAVGDEANPAVVHSRLVEYLIEMHRMDQAQFASRSLQRYPADLGAQVALAQYAKAAGDNAQFSKLVQSIVSYLRLGADRRLTWDRRASLAVVLALGGHEDLSQVQVQRCLRLLDPDRVREMTTGSLFHLLVLARHFGLEIPDAKARALAVTLLPAELRERL